jgi:hypothetical protein
MHQNPEASMIISELIQEFYPVLIVKKNIPLLVATACDVI